MITKTDEAGLIDDMTISNTPIDFSDGTKDEGTVFFKAVLLLNGFNSELG
jgi:hypothetical protein